MARTPLTEIAVAVKTVALRSVSGYSGILFIGDVHAISSRPGRRIDDYAGACMRKLRQCVDICLERNLYPVCLGDLFHKAREHDNVLQTRMMQELRRLKDPMVLIGGSHDRVETLFTPQDAAHLLEAAGVLTLVDEPRKIITLDIAGKSVNLWGIPTGCKIPSAIDGADADYNLMITHHELDFHGAIPDFTPLHEIENCDILVNGHLHSPAPRVIKGQTACYNPGSITRPSIDLVNHKPVVSVWTPSHGNNLESVRLVIEDNVFDLTGKEVHAAEEKALSAHLGPAKRLSSFATMLRATNTLEARRTDDGTVMLEELDNYFKTFDKPTVLRKYLTELVGQVVDTRLKKAGAA